MPFLYVTKVSQVLNDKNEAHASYNSKKTEKYHSIFQLQKYGKIVKEVIIITFLT